MAATSEPATEPSRKKRPGQRRKLGVRLSEGKSEDVLRLCLPALCCSEVQRSAGQDCVLQWIKNGDDNLRTALESDGVSLVNRLPGMMELSHKVPFARAMSLARRLCGAEYAFVPRTFILPDDTAALQASLGAGQRMIVKPDAGSQGDGIFVTDSWRDLQARLRPPASSVVAQEYIAAPLTLHGLKFDLRVYVLLTSLDPLRAFVCREGLARFATSDYGSAGARDLTAHLTNYSLNVRDAAFQHHDDPDDGSKGSKRTLSSTLRELTGAVPVSARTNGEHCRRVTPA